MTGALLDFFTLEASEYVDQLDRLVTRATVTPPDAEAFARALRALRGAALMANLPPIVERATSIERRARHVREGTLPWDTDTRAVLLAAIDDVRKHMHQVRGGSTTRPTPMDTATAAPSGAALRDLLATSLSGLAHLAETQLAPPVIGEEDDVIPIEDLLLRGRDALERAVQISDALRDSGAVPDPATLSELYDLLQLAAAE